jgi:cobalt-zinc-cadmium efflux system outer membrane protein
MRRLVIALAVCVASGSPAARSAPPEPLDLPALWRLALANNPLLREARARLAAARGRQIQAAKYPNPQVSYEQEELGTSKAPAGAVRVQLSQEIVTGGKRRLDVAVATCGVDAAALALQGQQFEVLTRLRRAYGEYLGWHYVVLVHREAVRLLEAGRESTRRLVETLKTRPETDLLRLDAVLEEARINLVRSDVSRQAAWRQLAAEVGVPDLSLPAQLRDLADPGSRWNLEDVLGRVLTANTDVKQAAVEVERTRLAVARAQAEAVPNVTVGGGYSRNFPEEEAGAVLSIQTRLPLWDRRQGQILAAQAEAAQAQAALRSAGDRLSRDTAEAFGRYQAARFQLERLNAVVLPKLEQSLKLVQEGYQTGSAQVSFADVLLAQQTLNDMRLRMAQTRRDLWRAVADLQGLMQLGLGEEWNGR